MSLDYDAKALRGLISRTFERAARSEHGGPPARAEKCLVAAKVLEYSSLEHASAMDAAEHKVRLVALTRLETDSGAQFFVHKGKERADVGMQIGRTWPFDGFSSLDVLTPDSPLLIVGFKRLYYWVFAGPAQRHEFETALRRIYYANTGLNVPVALTPPPVPQVSRRRTVSRSRSPRSASEGPPQPLVPPRRGSATSSPQPGAVRQFASPQPGDDRSQSPRVAAPQGAYPGTQARVAHSPQTMQGAFPGHAASQLPQGFAQGALAPHAKLGPQGAPYPPAHGLRSGMHSPPPPAAASAVSPVRAAGYTTSKVVQQQPLSSAQAQFPPQRRTQLAQPPAQYAQPTPQHAQPTAQYAQSRGPAPPMQQALPVQPAQSAQPVQPQPRAEDVVLHVTPPVSRPLPQLQSPAHLPSPARADSSTPEEPVRARKERPVLPPLNVNFEPQPGSLMSPLHSPARRRDDESPRPLPGPATPGLQTGPQSAPPAVEPQLIAPLRMRAARGPASAIDPSPPLSAVPQAEAPLSAVPPSTAPLSAAPRSSPAAAAAEALLSNFEEINASDIAVPRRSPSRTMKRMSMPQRAPAVPDAPDSPIKSPDHPSNDALSAALGAALAHRPVQSSSLSPARTKMQNLNRAIAECKWDGLQVQELERAIGQQLSELADRNFSGVVSIDSQAEQLSQLVQLGLEETQNIDRKMQAVAMNLAGHSPDVAHIEGQGDGLQVLTVSYRSLAQEIEKILACAQIDDAFVQSFSGLQFGNPGAPDAAKHVAAVEHELRRLYKCQRMLKTMDDGGQMVALRRSSALASKAAQDVSAQFAAFLTAKIKATNAAVDNFEIMLFRNFYIYSGCALFVQDTSPEAFRSLLRSYEKLAQSVYVAQDSANCKDWLQKADAIVGSRQVQAHVSAETLQQEYHEGAPRPELPSVRLPPAQLDRLYNLMQHIVDRLCTQVAYQRQFIVEFFHLGADDALSFVEYVKKYPLPSRRADLGARLEAKLKDALRATASGVPPQTLENVFSSTKAPVAECLDGLVKRAPLEVPYLLVTLDYRGNVLRQHNLQYLADYLASLYSSLAAAFDQYTRQQTKVILGAHFITKKRVGIHPVVSRFTEHLSIIENSYAAGLGYQRTGVEVGDNVSNYQCTESRELLDRCHTSVFRAIAQGLRMGAETNELLGSISTAARLKAAAKETAAGNSGEEAKFLLNRHVVMIENLYRICTDLEPYSSPGITGIVKDARQNYNRELESYIADVLSRPLSKLMQFLHHYESRSTQPSKQKEVLSQLKRTVQGFDGKEIRKGIESLRRRVEKHFTEAADPAVFGNVWHAIGKEYLAIYDKMYRIAQNVDGVSYLQVQRNDVTAPFA